MNSGLTHDGSDVLPEYGVKLAFSMPCVMKDNYEAFGVGIWLEFNANADGKKFPYLVIQLGKHMVQAGWLWG